MIKVEFIALLFYRLIIMHDDGPVLVATLLPSLQVRRLRIRARVRALGELVRSPRVAFVPGGARDKRLRTARIPTYMREHAVNSWMGNNNLANDACFHFEAA